MKRKLEEEKNSVFDEFNSFQMQEKEIKKKKIYSRFEPETKNNEQSHEINNSQNNIKNEENSIKNEEKNDEEKNEVFIKGFTKDTTEENIMEFFKNDGVNSFRILYDKDTSQTKCCGFLKFNSTNEAAKAIEKYHDYPYTSSTKLVMNWSKNSTGGVLPLNIPPKKAKPQFFPSKAPQFQKPTNNYNQNENQYDRNNSSFHKNNSNNNNNNNSNNNEEFSKTELVIFGLSQKNEESMKKLINSMIKPKQFRYLKDYGFIDFATNEDAKFIIEKFNGQNINGDQIALKFAKPKKDKKERSFSRENEIRREEFNDRREDYRRNDIRRDERGDYRRDEREEFYNTNPSYNNTYNNRNEYKVNGYGSREDQYENRNEYTFPPQQQYMNNNPMNNGLLNFPTQQIQPNNNMQNPNELINLNFLKNININEILKTTESFKENEGMSIDEIISNYRKENENFSIKNVFNFLTFVEKNNSRVSISTINSSLKSIMENSINNDEDKVWNKIFKENNENIWEGEIDWETNKIQNLSFNSIKVKIKAYKNIFEKVSNLSE
jgi:RNA recognition motif-containing protein